jgi:CrcB protein
MFLNYLIVAAGGAVGSALRYGIGQLLAVPKGQFPWSTLVVNLFGCFAMGVLLQSGLHRHMERTWLLAGVGCLGALTTYSAFSGDTLQLIMDKSWSLGIANVIANLLGSLLVCAAGMGIAKWCGI